MSGTKASEQPGTGSEDASATPHLEGLQWGKSGLEMDEERKQQVSLICDIFCMYLFHIGFISSKLFLIRTLFIPQIAYEYLCRLEEVRVWISKCVGEDLPPVGKGVLEDSLRNGVHLAKLAASFAPHIVQVIMRSESFYCIRLNHIRKYLNRNNLILYNPLYRNVGFLIVIRRNIKAVGYILDTPTISISFFELLQTQDCRR